MPKSKYKALIFSISETKKQLDSGQISIADAELLLNKLLVEYNEIKKSSESDDFNNYLNKIFK